MARKRRVRAECQIRLRHWPRTADGLARVLRRAAERGNGDLLMRGAVDLDRLGYVEEAAAAYRLTAEYGYSAALFNLGTLYKDHDRPEEAEEPLRQAVAAGDTLAYNNLGIALRQLERWDEAEQAYQAAIAHGSTRALYNLALLLEHRGRIEEAVDAYRAASAAGDADAAVALDDLLADTEHGKDSASGNRQ